MENKFKNGDKVYISNKSEFKDQGIKNGKKILGVVKIDLIHAQFKYDVLWEDGTNYYYADKDLELANIEPNYEIY